MNTENKIEQLKFIIGRFDHYYDSINSKGNLYLAINTFILAGVIAGYYTLDQKHHFNGYILTLLLIPTLMSNFFSLICTLSAIRPFTLKHHHASRNSLLFFVEVNQQTNAEWETQWAGLTEQRWQEELQTQSKVLAKGLNIKFSSLNLATLFIAFQATLILLFAIYFLTF